MKEAIKFELIALGVVWGVIYAFGWHDISLYIATALLAAWGIFKKYKDESR